MKKRILQLNIRLNIDDKALLQSLERYYNINSASVIRMALADLARRTLQTALVTGLELPGWSCTGCGAFNGEAKEELKECRGCGGYKTHYAKGVTPP